jgi:hypothetical protein
MHRITQHKDLGDKPRVQSGRLRKVWLPPDFDLQTVRPVASRYIAWVIPAHIQVGNDIKKTRSYVTSPGLCI